MPYGGHKYEDFNFVATLRYGSLMSAKLPMSKPFRDWSNERNKKHGQHTPTKWEICNVINAKKSILLRVCYSLTFNPKRKSSIASNKIKNCERQRESLTQHYADAWCLIFQVRLISLVRKTESKWNNSQIENHAWLEQSLFECWARCLYTWFHSFSQKWIEIVVVFMCSYLKEYFHCSGRAFDSFEIRDHYYYIFLAFKLFILVTDR